MSSNGQSLHGPGRRLDVSARRAQLLRVSAELFANEPFNDVWIDDVAQAAGVSRGLLYYHFGSKRGLLLALVEQEASELLRRTEGRPELALAQRLRSCLGEYLSYAESHSFGYRALYNGAASSDQQIREIVERNMAIDEQRIIDALAGIIPDTIARFPVRSWIRYLIATCLQWLEDPCVPKELVIDSAISCLSASLKAAQEFDARTRAELGATHSIPACRPHPVDHSRGERTASS